MSAHCALAGWGDGNMPASLLRDATTRGCGPVKNFFDRDGITLPPFFFDEQPENKEYVAAYVCERNKRYFLVLPVVESSSSCKQRELVLGRTMPGGLATFPRRLALPLFRKLENSKQETKNTDVSVFTQFRPLVLDYDGIQRVFYCHEGQWLETRFD